jgi:hypothetical protein
MSFLNALSDAQEQFITTLQNITTWTSLRTSQLTSPPSQLTNPEMFSLIQPFATHDVDLDDISAGGHLCENELGSPCVIHSLPWSFQRNGDGLPECKTILIESGFCAAASSSCFLLYFISAGCCDLWQMARWPSANVCPALLSGVELARIAVSIRVCFVATYEGSADAFARGFFSIHTNLPTAYLRLAPFTTTALRVLLPTAYKLSTARHGELNPPRIRGGFAGKPAPVCVLTARQRRAVAQPLCRDRSAPRRGLAGGFR